MPDNRKLPQTLAAASCHRDAALPDAPSYRPATAELPRRCPALRRPPPTFELRLSNAQVPIATAQLLLPVALGQVPPSGTPIVCPPPLRERPRTSANVRERPRTPANARERPRTPENGRGPHRAPAAVKNISIDTSCLLAARKYRSPCGRMRPVSFNCCKCWPRFPQLPPDYRLVTASYRPSCPPTAQVASSYRPPSAQLPPASTQIVALPPCYRPQRFLGSPLPMERRAIANANVRPRLAATSAFVCRGPRLPQVSETFAAPSWPQLVQTTTQLPPSCPQVAPS